MPTYNSEKFICQSVQSVLAQTHEDFELLVVNDASTDETLKFLQQITDRRLRVLNNSRNLGIVKSLNRAMSEAKGTYIARMDADDLCLPTRFAKQKAYLDHHPLTEVVGCEMSVLQQGSIRFSRQKSDADPQILRWMMHISNPVGHPSIMFRAETIATLGTYLNEDFECAEDFEFYHRILRIGNIAVLPEYLVMYRQHETNVTRLRRPEMISRVAAVLQRIYAILLGEECRLEATLVSKHLIAGIPLSNGEDLEKIGILLNRLITSFASTYSLNEIQLKEIIAYTGKMWWRMVQGSIHINRIGSFARSFELLNNSGQTRPSPIRIVRSLVRNLLPKHISITPIVSARSPHDARRIISVSDTDFCETPICSDDPPRLYVVVDTEAEFDWGKELKRSSTGVKAMGQQFLAQSIFDQYGVRPIYVVDYPVASQAEGYEPLRLIFNRHGCAIGAHLHPWVNPPFEEEVSEHNSYGGNLPPSLEEQKLRVLIAAIEKNFGVSPYFFKAGRYGIGPSTMDILARLGFEVDFSILPLADLRANGGPDFRFTRARPYKAASDKMLSIPMTRGQIGLLAPLTPRLHGVVRQRLATRFHVPGALARMNLANTITLTPEGVSADEQIRLIKAMVKQGNRIFTLHYHSPSLARQTPYVKTEEQLRDFLDNIEVVCHYFFLELGGLPGNPADLLKLSTRDGIWINNVIESELS